MKDASHLIKYQCYIDTLNILDCSMIVLPSPLALDNENMEYFDDYYIDLSLSSVEGGVYFANIEAFLDLQRKL